MELLWQHDASQDRCDCQRFGRVCTLVNVLLCEFFVSLYPRPVRLGCRYRHIGVGHYLLRLGQRQQRVSLSRELLRDRTYHRRLLELGPAGYLGRSPRRIFGQHGWSWGRRRSSWLFSNGRRQFRLEHLAGQAAKAGECRRQRLLFILIAVSTFTVNVTSARENRS